MKEQKTVMNYRISVISLLVFTFGFSLNAFAQKPKETPPPPAEPTSLTLPEVKEMILDNGLKVVVVRKRGLPLVTVSLLVKDGAEVESENKAGLAELTANTLIKGTQFKTATNIAEEIDFLGGSLDSGANWNSTTVNLNVMTDKLGKALSIMSDSVIRPTFPAKEIALAKKQTLDGFTVSLKDPGELFGYVASRYAFDEHVSDGTQQTLRRIRRRDVVNFHKEFYTPSNSVLIFTGDISAKQAFGFSKLFFNSWTDSGKTKEIIANILETPPITPPKIETVRADLIEQKVINRMLVIDLPKSGQAAVGYATTLSDGRIDCDFDEELESQICKSSEIYYFANVLNSVLGGGYSARLNQEIRLKRGLSYGARSGFDWRDYKTNFNAITQTKNESAAEVAELIKIEIEKLAIEAILEKEITPRKAVITGSFGRALQSNNALAARLRDLYLYDIKTDELDSFMKNIRGVSDSQVKEFASNNLLGGDMIIVGDASLFMDDLKKRFPNQKIEVIEAKDLDLNREGLRKR